MSDFDDDPIYLQSRREATVILTIWFLCFVWTVSYCYWKGYTDHAPTPETITEYLPDHRAWNRDPESLETPYGLGIPDWCFWGVAVPWVGCMLFSAFFSLFYMTDLQEADAEESETEAVA